MGEYAHFGSERVKIGTCEDMLYLRADQVALIRAVGTSETNVGDLSIARECRFRFPFPHEDGVAPGNFRDSDYGIAVPGAASPIDTFDHYRVQFTAKGYNVTLPCPEDPTAGEQPYSVHRNGFPGAVRIVQQRIWESHLALVCECGGCGARYRLEQLADAEPIIVACRAAGDQEARQDESRAKWWHTIADRITAGYLEPLPPPWS